ncbi:FHA domain-containing protein [Ruminococcus sp. AF42-9BH]|nr:FHA domain-containing protein [Ruminococcus sp. AF42-9BH]RHQ97138.1 FHA domain-containing protein [Ruminococcus sp. AF21-3]
MRAEYKRDMNHNYLILYGEDEINTDSYQVRMLVGNVIPSLLKCRIQGMDGRFLVYFDITSKQALSVLYEEKKMGVEDLRLIFGGFVKAMEDAAEYLMNPGQFIISPEYIYTDIEKQEIYFCMMPGYEKDIKEQFQFLTEYILPKIDHQDQDAVILGYGVYKRAMEDSFHLEHIKEELYKTQGQQGTTTTKAEQMKTESEQRQESEDFNPEEEGFWENEEINQEFVRDGEKSKRLSLPQKTGVIVLAAILLCGIAATTLMGYLPYLETGTILGIIIVLVACVMLFVYVSKIKKKPGALRQGREEERDKPKGITGKVPTDQTDQSQNTIQSVVKSTNKPVVKSSQLHADYGETVVLSAGAVSGPASLVSKEPGELATIYINEDLTVIGKLETACDAVISLPTVSRIHAKIKKKEDAYYLTDMNSRNGTAVNGRLLLPDEEYQLEPEDEVDFAQARYIFLP